MKKLEINQMQMTGGMEEAAADIDYGCAWTAWAAGLAAAELGPLSFFVAAATYNGCMLLKKK